MDFGVRFGSSWELLTWSLSKGQILNDGVVDPISRRAVIPHQYWASMCVWARSAMMLTSYQGRGQFHIGIDDPVPGWRSFPCPCSCFKKGLRVILAFILLTQSSDYWQFHICFDWVRLALVLLVLAKGQFHINIFTQTLGEGGLTFFFWASLMVSLVQCLWSLGQQSWWMTDPILC